MLEQLIVYILEPDAVTSTKPTFGETGVSVATFRVAPPANDAMLTVSFPVVCVSVASDPPPAGIVAMSCTIAKAPRLTLSPAAGVPTSFQVV